MGKRVAIAGWTVAGILAAGSVVGGVRWWGRSDGVVKADITCATTSRHAKDVAVAQMCTALRDGGLPQLLGVPGEQTRQAMSFGSPGNGEDSDAMVHEVVRVGPYMVSLTQYRGFPLNSGMNGGPLTVAGHKADWYETAANGDKFWTVEASWDVNDTGAGTYAVFVSNEQSPLSKEDTLRLSTAVAEKVLPTLPNWRSK